MSERNTSIPDPLEAWRQWVDQAERRWNSTFNELMGTEQFSQASGRMMEAWLAMAVPSATVRLMRAVNVRVMVAFGAIDASVGNQSGKYDGKLVSLPAATLPGQRTRHGTRSPPS